MKLNWREGREDRNYSRARSNLRDVFKRTRGNIFFSNIVKLKNRLLLYKFTLSHPLANQSVFLQICFLEPVRMAYKSKIYCSEMKILSRTCVCDDAWTKNNIQSGPKESNNFICIWKKWFFKTKAMKRITFKLKFNLKLIKLVFFLYFDVSFKRKQVGRNFWPTL